MSWYDNGMPIIDDPEVLATAELIRRLYAMPRCGLGGPLHAMLDDGNIDDEQINSDYYHATDGRTIETYLCKHQWVRLRGHVYDDELYCSPEVADLARLILASFRRMTEPWRAAAIAWYDGTAWKYIEHLAGEPLIGGPPSASPAQVDDLIADLRRWIEQGETSGTKACNPVPCPPFTEFSGVVHPGPGMRFAPDAKITGPFDSVRVNDDGTASITGMPLLGDAPEGAPTFRDSTSYAVYADGSVETSRWTAEDVLRATTAPHVSAAEVLDDPRQIRPTYPSRLASPTLSPTEASQHE